MADVKAIESKHGGRHGNLWDEASVDANDESATVDISASLYQQVFGESDAETQLTILVSQDGARWYTHDTIDLQQAGDFSVVLQLSANWLKLRSSAAAQLTATCARKGRA